MSVPILLFSLIVVAFTIAIVTSVVLAIVVLRTRDERAGRRVAKAALLPWGALDAWRCHCHRALVVAWASSIVLYGVLRLVAAAAVPYA